MEIHFKPTFVRQFKKLPPTLKKEVLEKVEFFRDPTNHQQLKVHKLKGRFKDCHSFSVNYAWRIVFMYENPDSAILLAVGDHEVYE